MEGNPKLQVEKPISEDTKSKHLEELCRETIEFVEKTRKHGDSLYREIIDRAIQRAEYIYRSLCKKPSNY